MMLRTLSLLVIFFNSLSFSKLVYVSYLVFNAVVVMMVRIVVMIVLIIGVIVELM